MSRSRLPPPARRRCAARALFAGLVLAAVAPGCASVHLQARATPARAGTGTFWAGAAMVDITPPAGLGLFGHGPEARRSRGHRGRLRCRALDLEDASGSHVALVACDLAAVSMALQRSVAAALPGDVGLGADRIVISATHTHGGPAHYFASSNYVGLFSGEVRGYDERVVRFLAGRIAQAITRAHRSRRPARIAWATARVNHDAGGGDPIGENRSLEAHCANEAPMLDGESTCGASPDPRAEVEGRLDLLRVDVERDGGFVPLALYGSFPVHGTVVPNTNAYYEGDLWGIAARATEARLRARGTPVVAVLANGAEGDVRPSYTRQDWDEARRLGTTLGARVADVFEGATAFEVAPRIDVAYHDLRLPRAPSPGEDARTRLCDRAELGRAAPGGSEEGRTGMFGRYFHEPNPDPGREGCQSPKRGFVGRRLGAGGFPDVAPLVLVSLGRGAVVAFPWEATTTAGLRLRQRVATALGTEGPVALVGLANEYVQYLTTPEEYAAQHYEGGSTLYGPATLEVVASHFTELARLVRLAREGGAPAPVHLEPVDVSGLRRGRHLHLLPRRPRSAAGVVFRVAEERCVPTLVVHAGAPGSLHLEDGAIVRLERADEHGAFTPARDAYGDPLDDTHDDFVFEHLGHDRGARVDAYRATWLAWDAPSGTYRFVVLGPFGSLSASEAFVLGEPDARDAACARPGS